MDTGAMSCITFLFRMHTMKKMVAFDVASTGVENGHDERLVTANTDKDLIVRTSL